MRDAHMIGILPQKTIELVLSSAKLRHDQFYFEDVNVASQLCITSLMVCQLGYVSATSHGSWFLLAEALKLALKEDIISEEDLFTSDSLVWRKLESANNKMVDAYLKRLQPGREFEYASKDEAEFYGKNKARYIDPLVLHSGKLKNTSQLVIGLAQQLKILDRSVSILALNKKSLEINSRLF